MGSAMQTSGVKKKKEKKKIAKNVQIFMVNRFNNEQS